MADFANRTRITLDEARKRLEMLSQNTSRTCHIVGNEDDSYSVFSHSELTNCDYCGEELLGITEHVGKGDIFISAKCFRDTDLP